MTNTSGGVRTDRNPIKRKSHKKSRKGCGNCKLRGVKCDEKRPGCDKCRVAHMTCSYKIDAADMQSCHEWAIESAKLTTPPVSTKKTILGMINGTLSRKESRESAMPHTFKLTLQDLDLLFRFQHGGVVSFGPQSHLEIYKTQAFRLSTLNPYLLHVVMTCTAMHDRYLVGESHKKRTAFEAYHWATASQLFNCEISKIPQVCDLDAIWMAAALMSWIVLYAVETQDPEEVWPLSLAAVNDIPWFPIQKGLRTLWDIVEKSVFSKSAICSTERCLGLPPPKPGVIGIPQALSDMCGLDESSNAQNNPYHSAVRTLSSLLDSLDGRPSSLRFLAFINTTEPEFEALLRQRDPRALLLMALWYELVPEEAWWMTQRASLERQAICIYLGRYHANEPLISTVLTSLQTTQQHPEATILESKSWDY